VVAELRRDEHFGAVEHALPAPVAPVVVVERSSAAVREDPALGAADVGERALAPEEIGEGRAGGIVQLAPVFVGSTPAAPRHGALHVDQTATLRHVRPAKARTLAPAQARQDEQLRQREPHPLRRVARAA
jgi:hypothetical protein